MRGLLRNGAGILFVLACIVFVGKLTYSFLTMSELQQASAAGNYQGQLPPAWLAVVASFSGAVSAAAVPFFGACLIDRINRYFAQHKEAAE